MAEDLNIEEEKDYRDSTLYGIGQMLYLAGAGLQGNLSSAISTMQKREEEKRQKVKEAQERAVKDKEALDKMNKAEYEARSKLTNEIKTNVADINKRKFDIMKDKTLSSEQKKIELNKISEEGIGMINGSVAVAESITKMTGNNYAQELGGYMGADVEKIVDISLDNKNVTVKDSIATVINQNPNMYGLGKDGNIYTKDKDGGLTDNFISDTINLDSVIKDEDKDSTMVSKGQDEYIIKDKDGNTIKKGVITNAEAVEYTDKGFDVSKIDKPKTSVTVNVNDNQETAEQAYAKATETFTKAISILNKGEELPDKDIESLLSAQNSKTAQAMRDDNFNEKISKMENELGRIIDLKDLAVKYKERMDSGKSGGIQEQLVVGAMKYIGSGGTLGDLTNMSEDDFAKAIGVTSVTTAQQMEIIKDLSGLAYTDSQLKQLQQILGTGFGKTYEARYKSINSYINYKKASLLKDANNKLFQKKAPATAYKTIKEFSDIKPKEKVDNNAQSRIDRIKERARKIREQKGY
jgi:hypothetical protein